MTNKILISLLLIIGSIGGLCAQDFIVLKTGKEIKAKIVELNPTEIRYKEFQNQNSSTLVIEKKYVFMVRYESGINEVVNAIVDQPKNTESPVPSPKESSRIVSSAKTEDITHPLATSSSTQPSETVSKTRYAETFASSEKKTFQEEPAINTQKMEATTPPQQKLPKTVATTPVVQNPSKVEVANTYPPNTAKPIITGDDSNSEGYTAGIFVGGAMPLKSYASADFKNNEKASGAKTGFCAGLQVGYRTKHKLSFIFEGQYALNPYEIKLEDVRNIYTLSGDWRHIAALVGVRSEMSLSKDVSLYALSLGGLSFASVSGDFADVLDLLDTKTSTKSFAYSFGFGLILKKHITIGIRTINSNPVFGDYKQSAYNAQGTIGFQF